MVLNKEDVLMDIITALRDDNNQVLVETVDAKSNDGMSWSSYDEKETYIPAPNYNGKFGNRLHAKSIKIGKEITIRKNDNGGYFVRTPKGEVTFDYRKDSGFDSVLSAALNKYELGPKSDYFYPVEKYMKKKFSDNAKDVKTEKASKFQNAVKQLEDLGVEPNRLKSYIKEKHPELTEEEVISIFMQQKQNG